MQITGSYLNYQNITGLLSSFGVNNSSSFIMQVFESSVAKLQDKIDKEIFSEESSKALSGLYSSISNLSGKASKLTLDDINSVFYDRSPVSSDSDVLTATAFDAFSSESGATEATYSITVTQLAQSQLNTGTEFNNGDVSSVNQGLNSFNINVNGEDFELSITVEDGDTNEIVLGKLASAINEESDLEISALVTNGTEEGTSKLVITADNPGETNEFSITDLSGNAVSVTGIDTVSQSAQDALYSIDGEEFSNSANTIYLDDNLVTVNLKGVGESTLTIAPDKTKVKDAITSFVQGINSFLDFLDENEDYITSDVAASINSYISEHKNALSSMGIVINDDGRLDIDETSLNEALNANFSGVKEVFGGFDGLALQVENQMNKMFTDSPLVYAKEAESMSSDFSDSIYDSSANLLSQIYQGALFNMYV